MLGAFVIVALIADRTAFVELSECELCQCPQLLGLFSSGNQPSTLGSSRVLEHGELSALFGQRTLKLYAGRDCLSWRRHLCRFIVELSE